MTEYVLFLCLSVSCVWPVMKQNHRLLFSPPCKSLLYAELFDTFFFTLDFWLGGVLVSAGEERLCTVDRENTTITALFSPQINIFMHMDYLKNANSVLIVRLCVCVCVVYRVWWR